MFKMKKGFTLIELLVVIAIIAILAAILFPVFAQAREKARQTSCLSNMKQIGTAFQLYVDDYDETTPGIAGWNFGGGGARGYMQTNMYCHPTATLYSYVKNSNIFVCPSAPNRNMLLTVYNYPTGTDQNGGSSPATGISYAINGLAYNYVSLAQISSTSSLIFCTEMNKPRSWNILGEYPSSAFIMPTPETDGGVATVFSNCGILAKWNAQEPHNGGQNVTYCDGHAKFAKTGTLTFRNQGINPPAGYNYDDPMPASADDMNNYNIMQAGKTFTARYE